MIKKIANVIFGLIISLSAMTLTLLPSLLSNEKLINDHINLFNPHLIAIMLTAIAAILCVVIGNKSIRKDKEAFGIGLIIFPTLYLFIFSYFLILLLYNNILVLLGFAVS